MKTNNNRQNTHNEIDRIFRVLLPTWNMAERPEQAALCHRMLDAMLEGGIALCDSKMPFLIQCNDSLRGCAFGCFLGAYSETIAFLCKKMSTPLTRGAPCLL